MINKNIKNISKKFSLLLLVLVAVQNYLSAQIVLPKIISNNMVLQRNKPVVIWGLAAAGEHITVKFSNQVKVAVADTSKHWQVVLDPMEASANPREMIISGSNAVKLENILVGEVWLCSGQSNMEYSMRKHCKIAEMKGEKASKNELALAKNPNIRIFLVNRKFMSPDPRHKGWEIAQDSALKLFSAVGYFYGKELYKNLNVPIGMISSAVSGSAIEPWLPSDAAMKLKENDFIKKNSEHGKFYSSMISPLAPFTISGFLWYQGETNCFLNEDVQYAYKMRLLINIWRKAWANDSLPFYFVQIAPFSYSQSKGKEVLTKETLPKFREAQTFALNIPHTGMVVITDLNDSISELHPFHKPEVARRLSLWALAKVYGKNTVYSGPVYKQMKIKGSKIELEFDYCGSGLVSRDGKPLDWFEISGADGIFVPAQAEIKGNKVIVSAVSVRSPRAVRFGWDETARPNLFNKEGLPAASFRTDNPLLKEYLKIYHNLN
ncbi:MAG: sialate O-acetylesterase [Bacteroidota bacterium]|nr:sialate O-acetylesterase [Bacteroidota bacterium]